jgi:cation transport regulator ChaB
MLKWMITHVVLFSAAAIFAVLFVSAFDAYYQDLEARRRAKWEGRRARSSHPANSGPRYE